MREGRDVVHVAPIVGGAFLSVALSCAGVLGFGPRATYAASKPLTDWSFCVRTSSTSYLYNLGCNQGQFNLNNNTNSLVFLDFGAQTSTGTLETIKNVPLSNSQVQSLAEQFAAGYYAWSASDNFLYESVGTNHNREVDAFSEKAWANVVKAVQTWSANANESNVTIWGGSDLEPGFSVYSDAYNWVQGYDSIDPAIYVNYGSAPGCFNDTGGSGSFDCSSGWTTSDIYYVSWGALPAVTVPQVHHTTYGEDWTNVSLYGSRYGSQGAINFEGPLDEYDLTSSSYTPLQAWDHLSSDLANHGLPSVMPYSLEVHVAN